MDALKKFLPFAPAAVGAGLLFLAWKGYIKNPTLKTAAIAVGATSLVRRVPVVNSFV